MKYKVFHLVSNYYLVHSLYVIIQPLSYSSFRNPIPFPFTTRQSTTNYKTENRVLELN